MRERAYASLVGTSVGDALGEGLPLRDNAVARRLPPAPWRWTDDTEMSCSVLHVLATHGHPDPAALAASFVAHHDTDRGYGAGAEAMMRDAGRGADLRELAVRAFGGGGSWGNGAAMRSPVLGAFYAGDPALAATHAAVTARITHTHPDGVAGAVAAAVAAAVAPDDVFAELLRHTAPGAVRDAVERAAAMRGADPAEAAAALGTGARTSALDTVPLALWVAARHAGDFPEAVWTAAALADDVDTLCAIVGGIVAAWTGLDGIPAQWLAAVEPLPSWV